MKKIVGILVMTLLIGTAILPVTGKITLLHNKYPVTFNTERNNYCSLKSTSDNTKLKLMRAGEGLRNLRSYWLHVPTSYDGEDSVPLVICLHGSSDFSISYPFWFFQSSWIEDYTKMSEKANEEGFIAVYPNSKLMAFTDPFGLIFSYDVPNYPKWFILRNLVDDVGFIQDLIEEMQESYNINPDRIYITGLSNGADFTYYLGSELSDIVAAIAPVAGAIAYKDEDDAEFSYIPDPENPVSVIVFHGTNDSLMPYEGDAWQIGINESVEFWVEHNGCDPIPDVNVSESGRIIRRTYINGDNGTEVVLYTTVGGDHWWPGNDWGSETGWLYDSIQEIDATDLIWEFFENHPKQ